MVTGVIAPRQPAARERALARSATGSARGFTHHQVRKHRGRGDRRPSVLAILAISFSAATRPMSRIGWRIVVSEGHNREASGLSSKPMTVRSSGIFSPRK